jgi:hypothetical protein
VTLAELRETVLGEKGGGSGKHMHNLRRKPRPAAPLSAEPALQDAVLKADALSESGGSLSIKTFAILEPKFRTGFGQETTMTAGSSGRRLGTLL